MVWIVGGGAALLVPGTLMVPAQRFAHIVENMTQNVAAGDDGGRAAAREDEEGGARRWSMQ